MEAFKTHLGTSAPLNLQNVDTDMIIPADYLKTIKRTGLAEGLFARLRVDEQGNRVSNFFMNQEQYKDASILVTQNNFGCGSSREHAPWALLDYGIRVILAPSFADIFYNNCFKNGILPIILPQAHIDTLIADANQASRLTVDLEAQMITRANGEPVSFKIEGYRRHNLLNGLDDIGLTLAKEDDITSFETRYFTEQPWAIPNQPLNQTL